MSLSCIVPNCKVRDSTGKKKISFMLPRDSLQLQIWQQNLPFVDFEDLELEKCRICAIHFDEALVIKGYKKYRLASGAVPTKFEYGTNIKDYLKNCRFCLKIIKAKEQTIKIDQNVLETFNSLTGNELNNSPVYSQIICKRCWDEAYRSHRCKKKLLRNQIILHKIQVITETNPISSIKHEISENEEDERENQNVEIKDEKSSDPDDDPLENMIKQIKNDHSVSNNSDIKVDQEIKELFDSDYKVENDDCDSDEDYPVSNKRKSSTKEKAKVKENKLKRLEVDKELSDSDYQIDNDDCDSDEDYDVSLKEKSPPKKKAKTTQVKKSITKRREGQKIKEPSEKTDSDEDYFVSIRRKLSAKKQVKTTKVKRSKKQDKKAALTNNLPKPPEDVFCDFCGKNYKSKYSILKHMRIHVTWRPFSCDVPGCKQSFMSSSNLGTHKKQRHLGLYDVYCEMCGAKFYTKEAFETHIRSKHTGERPYVCDFESCGKAFFSLNSVRTHKRTVHCDPIPCPISGCGKILASSQVLRCHLKYHNNAQKFICHYENCKKRCISNYVLQNHIKTNHLGLAEHTCKECPATFFKKNSLQKHIRAIHMKIRLNCEVQGCTGNFSGKQTYRVHVLSAHKNLGNVAVEQILKNITTLKLINPLEKRPNTS